MYYWPCFEELLNDYGDKHENDIDFEDFKLFVQDILVISEIIQLYRSFISEQKRSLKFIKEKSKSLYEQAKTSSESIVTLLKIQRLNTIYDQFHKMKLKEEK